MGWKGEVLIVDDDADLLEMVSVALARDGFRTTGAVSGEEAVARVTAGGFDLVLLDIMMPGMGGIAALSEIKRISPGVEVVILTAHGSVDTAVESMRLGAFDYLKKPFSITDLCAVADRAVEKRRFNEIAKAAFCAEDPVALLATVAVAAARLFCAERAFLQLEDRGAGRRGSFYPAEGGMPPGAGFCPGALKLLRESGSEVLALNLGDPRLEALGCGADHDAVLLTALSEGERVTGLLCACRPAGQPPFGDAELRRAKVLGPLVSLAVRNSELNGELRSTRVQLLHNQKMEALGMLAGQVTHDFNNLLTVIIGSVQLLRENPSPGNSVKLSGDILNMAREAEALIKQLLLFSRSNEAPAAPSDLNLALNEVKFILGKLAGKNIKVEYLQTGELPRVRIRPEHFKQVALNLAVNARDSMPSGGKVTIATRAAGPDEILPAGLKSAEYVVLEVSDEGPGIPAGNLERIFDPFFTTKEAGKGTGLGLHIAQSVAREYGGGIQAGNRAEGGASFRVFLPAER